MENLISMTDFIVINNDAKNKQLKDFNEHDTIDKQFIIGINNAVNRFIDNYARILNQPIKKGMFVPVDGNNNVLSEPCLPSKDQFWNSDTIDSQLYANYTFIIDKYKEALSNVLFKGWEYYKENDLVFKDNYAIHFSKESILFYKNINIKSHIFKGTTSGSHYLDKESKDIIKDNLSELLGADSSSGYKSVQVDKIPECINLTDKSLDYLTFLGLNLEITYSFEDKIYKFM